MCPSSTSDDNVQCCSENIEHSGLKIRQFEDDFDISDPISDLTTPSSASGLGDTLSVGTTSSPSGGDMALTLPPALGSTVGTTPAPAGLGTFDPAGSSFTTPAPVDTAFTPAPATVAITNPAPAPVPETITTTPAPATIPNAAFNTPVTNNAQTSTFDQNSNAVVSAFHSPWIRGPGEDTGGGLQPIIAVDPKTRLLNVGFNTGNGLRATYSPIVPVSSLFTGNIGDRLGAGGMVNLGINFKA